MGEESKNRKGKGKKKERKRTGRGKETKGKGRKKVRKGKKGKGKGKEEGGNIFFVFLLLWLDGCSPSAAFQGFKVVSQVVSNTCLGALSILGFWK